MAQHATFGRTVPAARRGIRPAALLAAWALVVLLLSASVPAGGTTGTSQIPSAPRTTCAPEATTAFTDVTPSHPFCIEIGWLVDEGIASGYPDGTFRSTTAVTRQAIAAMLWRLAGSPDVALPDPPTFTDVGPAHPFATAIAWLVEEGIANGYADGTFRSTSAVTRQAIAAMLWRYNARFIVPSTLQGTVTTAGVGTPIRHIAVTLHDAAGMTVTGTTTAADGTWTIADVTPGTYALAFADPTETHDPQWFDAGSTSAEATPLVVYGSSTLTLDAELAPTRLEGVVDIAAGTRHTCAVDDAGAVHCWGANDRYSLGDASGVAHSSPFQVPGVSGATAVAVGEEHSCALLGDGTVRCWGDDRNGQLGDGAGNLAPQATPTEVVGVAGAVDIVAGLDHSCALLDDGTARCWGGNQLRQVGNSSASTNAQPVPLEVSGLADAVAISSSWDHTCAALEDGTARCWGTNSNKQLGDGTNVTPTSPVTVAGLTGAVSITVGTAHSCAALDDGTASCWGGNFWGQLGDGTTTARPAPTPVAGLSGIATIDAGHIHTCATLDDGTARCWGRNQLGQLGNGTTADALTPSPVAGIDSSTSVSSGYDHTCVVLADATARCWGDNGGHQLGDGGGNDSRTPVLVDGIETAASIGAGEFHTCAVLDEGTASCWGHNYYGQLGDGTLTGHLTPEAVGLITDAESTAVGYSASCALLAGGAARCWGDNWGSLGDGTTIDRPLPVEVIDLTGAVSLSMGKRHACAVDGDGAVWCWGNNSSGALGTGTIANSYVPAQVVGITDAVAVAAGAGHTCALHGDGQVSCWGERFNGQLGSGAGLSPSLVPIAVPDIEGAVAITTAKDHTCALIDDGTAWCWGVGQHGQRGHGYVDSHGVAPNQVVGLTDAIAISAGFEHTCAVLRRGAVRCWGLSSDGQLGFPSRFDQKVPVSVSNVGSAVSISAGATHTCVVLADGTARCWGGTVYGPLGDGSDVKATTPVVVGGVD